MKAKYSTLLSIFSTVINISHAEAAPPLRRDGLVSIPLDGKVPKEEGRGSAYTAKVKIDNKDFDLKLDTASPMTWVAHISCVQCLTFNVETIEIDLPDECGDEASMKMITYGAPDDEYTISGCYQDVPVRIGEYSLEKYPVFIATTVEGMMVSSAGSEGFSGYLGVGPSSKGEESNSKSVLRAMLDQGIISTREIGLYLPPQNQGKGKLELGDLTKSEHVDASKIEGTGSNPTNHAMYEVNVEWFKINETVIAKDFTAKLDTTSSSIIYPNGIKDSLPELYRAQMGELSTTYNAVPCEPQETVTMSVGGHEYTIRPQDMVRPSVWNDGTCRPNIIVNASSTDDLWVFGTAFLHNVYSSLNFENGETKIFELKE